MTIEQTDLVPPDLNCRRAGLLLHPTSLPSGVLDSDVERWLQLLEDGGFSIWQVLPLCQPQHGLSPYQCSSTFAMNTALLDEYPKYDEQDEAFVAFCRHQQHWLDDFVLFKALKQHFNNSGWYEWPDPWKFRDAQMMHRMQDLHSQLIADLKWEQFQLHQRWHQIRSHARQKGILLFGDLPIFVGHDSADVWAHPEWFLLDENGMMEVVTGVPPDYFSETGQRWGNPHYDWEAMQADDFGWWRSRILHHLEMFDLLRIDHFRGLEATWMIQASCETAVEGYWQKVPGDAMFASLQSAMPGFEQLPFVAEDLGIITPEVIALRKKYHLPGMSILQFGFDAFEDNPHKPQNITDDHVVYTGTHDNDTTKGWFNSLEDHVKTIILQTLESRAESEMPDNDGKPGVPAFTAGEPDAVADWVVDVMINSAMFSKADICIIPMQDYLRLDGRARMNTPGTTTGNWNWKFQWRQYDAAISEKMHNIISRAGRLVAKQSDPSSEP